MALRLQVPTVAQSAGVTDGAPIVHFIDGHWKMYLAGLLQPKESFESDCRLWTHFKSYIVMTREIDKIYKRFEIICSVSSWNILKKSKPTLKAQGLFEVRSKELSNALVPEKKIPWSWQLASARPGDHDRGRRQDMRRSLARPRMSGPAHWSAGAVRFAHAHHWDTTQLSTQPPRKCKAAAC